MPVFVYSPMAHFLAVPPSTQVELLAQEEDKFRHKGMVSFRLTALASLTFSRASRGSGHICATLADFGFYVVFWAKLFTPRTKRHNMTLCLSLTCFLKNMTHSLRPLLPNPPYLSLSLSFPFWRSRLASDELYFVLSNKICRWWRTIFLN